jgi:hypothetical protein
VPEWNIAMLLTPSTSVLGFNSYFSSFIIPFELRQLSSMAGLHGIQPHTTSSCQTHRDRHPLCEREGVSRSHMGSSCVISTTRWYHGEGSTLVTLPRLVVQSMHPLTEGIGVRVYLFVWFVSQVYLAISSSDHVYNQFGRFRFVFLTCTTLWYESTAPRVEFSSTPLVRTITPFYTTKHQCFVHLHPETTGARKTKR